MQELQPCCEVTGKYNLITRYAEVMAFARLEHDFPVIEGPQGSLPLTAVSSSNESTAVLQCFPCLQRGLKGHSYSVLEEPGGCQTCPAREGFRAAGQWASRDLGQEELMDRGADGLEGRDPDFLGRAENGGVR